MTLSDLVQLVWDKLGDQSLFYGREEIVRSGINPAQRLLCLVYPLLSMQRVTVTVIQEQAFIDLRTLMDSANVRVGHRVHRVSRVVLGNVTTDTPSRTVTGGELHELRLTTVGALSRRANNWMTQRGLMTHYWLWGAYWLGLYKRVVTETVLTVIFHAMPAPMENDADTPDIDAVYHSVIAEVATGLLLVKEGQGEGERGVARVVKALNLQPQGAVA